jgi:hypothetical protein
MRLSTKKLFCENTSPYIKALILKKRAGIPLSKSEERQFEKEIFKETVSMVQPTKYHDRLASLPQPISEPYVDDLEGADAMSNEEVETLIRSIILDIIYEEEVDDYEWNEMIENLVRV